MRPGAISSAAALSGAPTTQRNWNAEVDEVTAREAVARSTAAPTAVATRPYTLTNLLLQIRIMDVQAFGAWENLLNERDAAPARADEPGPSDPP